MRLLEHVIHCLDESSWPFKTEEILATLGARSNASMASGTECTSPRPSILAPNERTSS